MQFYVDPEDERRARDAFEANSALTLVGLTEILRRDNVAIPLNVVAYLWRSCRADLS